MCGRRSKRSPAKRSTHSTRPIARGSAMDERLALTIVTGFLGSGKTTLVRRFLATPAGTGTGVIVNEFGEVGLDHRLLVHAAEHVDVVDGGCLCCRRRTDV